jgi:transposase
LSGEQRADLEMAMRPEKAERRIVTRAQAALLLADGVPTSDVAKLLGVHLRTVEKWRVRFSCADPVKMLADAPRSGRPRALSRKPIARES